MAKEKSQFNISLAHILKRPRITEKATMLGEGNVYTFEVDKRANKDTVAKAVEAVYKVKPLRVNIINIPRKKITVGGRLGIHGGGKKALVQLKKGEKIEFV